MQLMDEIKLTIPKAFRELLLAVQVLGLRLAVLAFVLRLAVLLGKLLDGLSLGHTVIYGAHKQAHNKEKENKDFIVELELRNICSKNIFGRFFNGMAEIILELAWSNLGMNGEFFAHEMMS